MSPTTAYIRNEGEGEYLVRGTLYYVLRLSQVVQTAPVLFTRRQNGWQVRVSRTLTYIAYLLITSMDLWITWELFMGLRYKKIDSASYMRFLAFYTLNATTMVTRCSVIYGCPTRLKKTFICLKQFQKINTIIHKNAEDKSIDYKICTITSFVILYTTLNLVLTIYNICRYSSMKSEIVYYIPNFTTHFLLLSMLLQFALSASEGFKVLRKINEELQQILQTPVHKRSRYPKIQGAKPVDETLHNLCSQYSVVCDAIHKLNGCSGFPILMILIHSYIYLIILCYFSYLEISQEMKITSHIFEMVNWSVIQVVWLLTLIEPCYRTEMEMERTKMLLMKLSLKYTDDSILTEVEHFIRYFLLNKVVYAPMGMCTLQRSVLAKITSSVTSYLVIVIQFQSLS